MEQAGPNRTARTEEVALVRVRFDEVSPGSFFKEEAKGAWHLKTARGTGMYRANGIDGEPSFQRDELVLTEAGVQCGSASKIRI